MKVAVDAGCLGVKDERLKVGVYQVVKNFLIELGKLDKKNLYLLYSFEPIDTDLLRQLGKNMKNIVVKPNRGWLMIWLPLRLLFDKPNLFLALNQSMPRFLNKMHTIGFVYDIAFEEFPQMYIPESVPKMSKNSRDLVKRADHLITISEWTKNEIVNLYNVKKDKIEVLYPGVSEYFRTSNQLPKYKNYFLFVGALKKSKNVPVIIKAFAKFLKVTNKKFSLYIAGGDKWLDSEIHKTIEELGLNNNVKIFGYVNSNDLLKLYEEAFAFVSPSLYEGFGITILEAMTMSCPVIVGNNTAQQEVVGQTGLLVNPTDVNSVKNAMLSLVNNKNLRTELIKKGLQRSKLFSWNKFAKSVYFRIKTIETQL